MPDVWLTVWILTCIYKLVFVIVCNLQTFYSRVIVKIIRTE